MRAKTLVIVCLLAAGCSIRGRALRAVADSLSDTGDGSAFAQDDDPELVADATPFALKTMESLALNEHLQDHVGLRLGLARGFTQYAFAFVQQPAEMGGLQPDVLQARLMRARKLYLRARAYGLEGLRLQRGVTEKELRSSDKAALAKLEKEDVPLVYWTIAPWSAAIAANKRDLELVGDVPAIAALLDRCLELDEAYDQGALHEFAITFDPARAQPPTPQQQRAHFDRALQLAQGTKISPYVTYAQAALATDKNAYVATLKQAASYDVNRPDARNNRLANVLAQERADYLLKHLDDVFSD